MADRIQQRRDTRARWEEFNPLLLEGEVGYVTDDPNLYKIGDGINRWNSLPYRGFDGTITQETGNSENAVMSQKAVSEKLSELASKNGIVYVGYGSVPTFSYENDGTEAQDAIRVIFPKSYISAVSANGKDEKRLYFDSSNSSYKVANAQRLIWNLNENILEVVSTFEERTNALNLLVCMPDETATGMLADYFFPQLIDKKIERKEKERNVLNQTLFFEGAIKQGTTELASDVQLIQGNIYSVSAILDRTPSSDAPVVKIMDLYSDSAIVNIFRASASEEKKQTIRWIHPTGKYRIGTYAQSTNNNPIISVAISNVCGSEGFANSFLGERDYIWESGTVSEDFSEEAYDARVRTLVNTNARSVEISINSGYRYIFRSENTYKEETWSNLHQIFCVEPNEKWRIVLAYDSNSSINPSEIETFVKSSGVRIVTEDAMLGSLADNVNRLISKVGEIDKINFNNFNLALSAKKQLMTYQEQMAIGLQPSVHYNEMSLNQIVHVSDIHADMVSLQRAVDVANALDADFVNSGDFVKSVGTEDISQYVSETSRLENLFLHCIGNHESWGMASETDVYNKFINGFSEDHGWGAKGKTYFYHDDNKNKIRYIVLNQWVKYANSNGEVVNIGVAYMGQSQIDFLISSLLSIQQNYGVIVLMHSPDCILSMNKDYTKFYQKTTYNGEIGMAYKPFVSKIIDAFISRTDIKETISSDVESVNITADFSAVKSNEFIAYMVGHTHMDAVTYVPNTNNNQLVLCVTTANRTYADISDTSNQFAETSDLGRIDNTPLQDCFNVYTVDRVKKVVKVVRIGSDIPFDFSERRDCMTIPYL